MLPPLDKNMANIKSSGYNQQIIKPKNHIGTKNLVNLQNRMGHGSVERDSNKIYLNNQRNIRAAVDMNNNENSRGNFVPAGGLY
jgi:hypothetical protein